MAEPDDLGDSAEELLVLISDERSARIRTPGPEPTVNLTVTVPGEVAEGLKEALAILPGVDLDSLSSIAVRQVLWDLGVREFPRRSRRRAEDPMIVLY
jgi:hypothetical protein